jgi:hypothetical protein
MADRSLWHILTGATPTAHIRMLQDEDEEMPERVTGTISAMNTLDITALEREYIDE